MIKVIKTKYGKPLLEWEDLECYVKDLEKEIEKLNYIIDKQDRDIVALSNGNRKLNNIINEFDEWLKEKKEQMEEFELYKRKETGAFWYSTMGNIETFIEKIKELKGDSSN